MLTGDSDALFDGKVSFLEARSRRRRRRRFNLDRKARLPDDDVRGGTNDDVLRRFFGIQRTMTILMNSVEVIVAVPASELCSWK
jgi:hypothetical protein